MKSYIISGKSSFLETFVQNIPLLVGDKLSDTLFLLPTKGAKIDFQDLYYKAYHIFPRVFVLNEKIQDDISENILFSIIFKYLCQELQETPLETSLSSPQTLIYLTKTFCTALNEVLTHKKERLHETFFNGEGLESAYFDLFCKVKKRLETHDFKLSSQKRIERSGKLKDFLKKVPPHRHIVAAGIVASKPFTLETLETLRQRENFHLVISCDDFLEAESLPQGHPFYLGQKLLKKLESSPQVWEGKTSTDVLLLECATLEEEAFQIAHHLVQFSSGEKKIAFVTQNSLLKTLVKEELLKFDIAPSINENSHFLKTPLGRFFYLSAQVLFSDFSIDTLFSFLKNPFSNHNFLEICQIELELRHKGLPISSLIKSGEIDKNPILKDLIWQRLIHQEHKPAVFYGDYLKNFLMKYIPLEENNLWDSLAFLPPLSPKNFFHVFESLLQNHLEKETEIDTKCSNIFFWNPLEARLRTADVMILGDLNENSWPDNSLNPWLMDKTREYFNIPSTIEYQGLSFLDFITLTQNAPVCIITRANLKSGKAQIPSRFLHSIPPHNKIKSYIENTDFIPLNMTYQFTATLDQKPLHLHQSDVKLLISNPYAFYLRKILKIKPILPFQKITSQRVWGDFIHKAFDHFIKNKQFQIDDFLILNIYQKDQFKRLLDNFEKKILEFKQEGWTFLSEHQKTISFGKVCVSARMDLVLKNEKTRIIDYKTSAPPSFKSVLEWKQPQLSLEALCFDDVASLEYWHTQLSSGKIQDHIIEPKDAWLQESQDFFQKLFDAYIKDDFVFEKSDDFFEKDEQHFMKIEF